MTTITASSTVGITLSSSSYTNPVVINPGVTISSIGNGITASASAWTIQNYGTIAGSPTSGVGIYLSAGGSVTNYSSGSISGFTGIYDSQALSVVNFGSIVGPLGGGIVLDSGGSVNNATSASVILGVDGVEISGSAGTVVNDGSIGGTGTTSGFGFGVALLAGGSVINAASASITGAESGVIVQGGPGTVVNDGNIVGAGSSVFYAGVALAAGGAVTNAASASITGSTFGVYIYGGGTLTNAGTVVGNTGTAVAFGGTGSNLLLLDPSYGLSGLAIGGTSASNTLELASAASAGTLSGLSTEFVDFVQTTIDADASWVFNGANTIEAGTTLTELSGSHLTITGTLVNYGAIVIDPSTLIAGGLTGTGTVTIDAGSTVTIAGTVSTGETIVFTGTDAVLNILDPAGFAGTVEGQGPSDQVNMPRTLVWTGAQNTNFANPFNWDDVTDSLNPASTPPGPQDTAEFLATGGTVTGTGTVAVLQFGSGGLWALGSGGALTSDTGITVGNGALAVDSGASIASEGSVDIFSGTSGSGASVTVSGTDAAWNSAGNLIVGGAGLGGLAIQADGTVVSNAGTIANQSGAGGSSVNVTGTGSDWQVGGALDVGNAATGVLAITNGASVSATTLDVGVEASGAGVVTVSGPGAELTTTGTVSVGDSGSGELSILDGANANIGGDLNVANAGTGTGNVDIEDTTGTITFGGNILVGFNGFGVFNVGFNVDYIQNNGGIIFGPDSSGAINSFADPSPFLSNSSPSPIAIGAQGIDQLAAYLFNSGEFTIPNNHSLTFDTPIIYGGGSFALGSGDSMVLNADTVAGQTFTLGSNDKLTIGIDQLATIDLPASGTGPFTPESNPNKGDLLLGNFGGVIANLTSGDTIDVDTYLSSASAGTLSQNGSVVSVIEIDNGATLGVLRFDTAANAAAAVADGAIALAPCFAAGTRIATERGEVAVEAIGVGEKVRVLLGDGPAEVIWVGRREVDCAWHQQPRKVWPMRVAAGAFGPGLPHTDLWLSPDHAVYVNEVLIPVRCLVNGSTIAQVKAERVVYHHVELAEHDVLLAEGLPVESFLDMRDRTKYANRAGPVRLYPDFSARMWEAFGCARLVVTGPEVDAARALVERFAVERATA
jgi:T5SS/PEP-CTERM-associated repeat protein